MHNIKVGLGLSMVSLVIVTIINQISLVVGQTERIPVILYKPLIMDATVYYGVGVKQTYGVDFQKMEVLGPSIEFHLPSFVLSWLVLWLVLLLLVLLWEKLRSKWRRVP